MFTGKITNGDGVKYYRADNGNVFELFFLEGRIKEEGEKSEFDDTEAGKNRL